MKLSTLTKIIRASDKVVELLDTSSPKKFHESLTMLTKGEKFRLYGLVKALKAATEELEEQEFTL